MLAAAFSGGTAVAERPSAAATARPPAMRPARGAALALLITLTRGEVPPSPTASADAACAAVTSKGKTTCAGSCAKANSSCELLDPTDPSTGCTCKAGPAPLPPVRPITPPRPTPTTASQ